MKVTATNRIVISVNSTRWYKFIYTVINAPKKNTSLYSFPYVFMIFSVSTFT